MTNPIRQTIGLPPTETVAFFRAKGTYPISRKWWEVWQEEHTRAFTVAGVLDRTVLEQVRGSVDKVLSEGGTFEMWKKGIVADLRAAVENGTAPLNILSDARLRIIYSTNLRMARAAGKWQRIQALKDVAPYLMYSAILDTQTRPLHKKWNGTILPVDHPWWNTHFPPCGWNCRCSVIQLSEADITDRGLKVANSPPDDGPNQDFIRGDGVVESVPAGIDPGFAYNVGQAHMRGLVPVPAEGAISEPLLAQAPLPPLPKPRDRSSSLLVPADASYQDVIDAFIGGFGARNSAGAVTFTDVTGEPLIVDDSFFYRGGIKGDASTEKLVDSDRRARVRLMAEGLRDPDEVWYVWEDAKRADGTMTKRLVRRYVARFTIDGKVRPIVVVMDISADGWKGITAIAAPNANYATSPKVRRGVLAYRRE